MHEQDDDNYQNNTSNDIVEYLTHQEMSNDYDNNNNSNNNINNETNDSPMLSHIPKHISSTKEKTTKQLPGDLNRLLSSNTSGSSTITTSKDNNSTAYNETNINGTKYRQINTLYCYSRDITKTRGALIDREANGGFSEDDVRVISKNF